MKDAILRVQNLTLVTREGHSTYKAVDDISYEVKKGEILGIVGESGCGKTITNLAVMGLLPDSFSVSQGASGMRMLIF